ncbi:MAG: fluoride efflux transporter CrcB [Deltaproteobacteria bacterium]|nr:fluoride efflux transporter CrcB [Deltaproteobacteria bacterium]
MNIKTLAFIALGGGIGSVLRYSVGLLFVYLSTPKFYPIATFSVNVVGSFLIGLVSGFAEKPGVINPQLQLFLMAGVLGGFTTFSAFSLNTLAFFRREEFLFASLNILLTVAFCLVAVWAGFKTSSNL